MAKNDKAGDTITRKRVSVLAMGQLLYSGRFDKVGIFLRGGMAVFQIKKILKKINPNTMLIIAKFPDKSLKKMTITIDPKEWGFWGCSNTPEHLNTEKHWFFPKIKKGGNRKL